jgi:hypothetical protein
MTDLTAPAPLRTGPMPFTLLLDEAMKRVRRHFRTIYPTVAIPLALLAGATGVFQALWFERLVDEIGADGPPPVLSIETILLGVLQGFLLVVAMMALQKAAVDSVAGRPIDMKAAWRFAIRPAVLGTLILQFLAVVASALACFFPVLYVGPLLSLTAPVMVAEQVFGPRALSRSAELTRYNPQGRFFETPLVKAFVLMLVTVMISYAVTLVVTLPFQIPLLIDIFRQAASGEEPAMGKMAKWIWIQIPSQILQMLATVAVYCYSSFGFALLFFDARGRKEGTDLASEIDSVFGPSGPGTPAGEPAP